MGGLREFSILEDRIGGILTYTLAAMLFWIGLGVGTNLSDTRFWIESTRTVMGLEWAFILLSLFLTRRFPFAEIWQEHRFTAIVGTAWAVWVAASWYFSPFYSHQNVLARMRLEETYSHMIFFIFLWHAFRHYRIDVRTLYLAIIASTLVVMGYFIYIHFAYPGLKAAAGVFSIHSANLILNTHVHRIGYQVMVAIVLLAPFLDTARRVWRVLAWFAFAALVYSLLWLGGRAAILGTASAGLFWLYMNRSMVSWKIIAWLVLFGLGMLALLLWWRSGDLGYLSHLIDRTFHARSLNALLSNRLTVWALVLENLQGHWLLGDGPQSYFFYSHRPVEVIHAHNFLLQFLGEWGTLGAGLFLWLLAMGWLRGYRLLRECRRGRPELYRLSAGMAIVALNTAGLFGGTWFFAQPTLYLVLAFAYWVTYR